MIASAKSQTHPVPGWNDDARLTHAEVIAAFDIASRSLTKLWSKTPARGLVVYATRVTLLDRTMPKPAMTELRQQIEAVRREAFALGYATAMKAVRELTARATPAAGDAAAPSRRERRKGRGRTRARRPVARPLRSRRSPRSSLTAGVPSIGRSAAHKPRRGSNALLVAEVLKSVAPRALRQAEIRRALQNNGTNMSFPSIGYSLRQLEARKAAKQGGDGKTWRYSGGERTNRYVE